MDRLIIVFFVSVSLFAATKAEASCLSLSLFAASASIIVVCCFCIHHYRLLSTTMIGVDNPGATIIIGCDVQCVESFSQTKNEKKQSD